MARYNIRSAPGKYPWNYPLSTKRYRWTCVKMFADDSKFHGAIESTDSPELLQNNVSKSEFKGGEWKMLYNSGKCQHVHIGEHIEAR